jgi:hypothetical protein
MLEITITHNRIDVTEVHELFHRRWIALDYGRKGPDPNAYHKRGAHTAVKLFHTMRQEGAAVIAAYKGATANSSVRIVGLVTPGAEFEQLNGLLCLPLSDARVVDSSVSFLGNLSPMQCTVQSCDNRAVGRLLALVRHDPFPRTVWSLHNRDVEILATNYLIASGLCQCVWSGSRAFENIDHAGYSHNGEELLAQTTVSRKLIAKKAEKLSRLARPGRTLHFFGPADAQFQCPAPIQYHPIESVFEELDRTPGGRWLIDRMLISNGTSLETQQ